MVIDRVSLLTRNRIYLINDTHVKYVIHIHTYLFRNMVIHGQTYPYQLQTLSNFHSKSQNRTPALPLNIPQFVVLWLIKWYDQCVLYGNGTTVAFGDSFLKCSFYGDISTYSYFHIVIKGRVNSCFCYEPQKECQKEKVTGVIGMSNIMFCIPCLKETEHNTLYGHNNTTIRYTNQVQKLTFRHDTWVLFAITERPSETVASVIWW